MTRILVAGSQRLFRVGLKRILTQHLGREASIHDSSDNSCLVVCRDFEPDIAILDIDIQFGIGLELAAHITEGPARPRVIIITARREPNFLIQLTRIGASAYLTKNCAESDLINAITSVTEGRYYVSEEFSRLVTLGRIKKLVSAHLSTLSRREMEVMLMLAQGRLPSEIGNYLKISPKTVASYKQRINGKLKTRNTADITRIALESGMLGGI